MDARLQRRIQRYGWDKAARHYEASWHEQLAPAQVRLLEMAQLRENDRVIDVACGTGIVTLAAAALVGPRGHVLGTDISEGMIALAHTRAESAPADVRFERMDAEDLQVSESSFDAALCALGLMYVPDPRKALGEMLRALRPGGRAVAAVWGQRDRCGWAEIFPIVDARVKSEVCPLFFGLGSADNLQREFARAGFTELSSVRLQTQLRYFGPEDACDAAFVGGPVALAYSRFDEAVRDSARAEYLASIAPYLNESGYAIPGEFVVTSGRKPD
jgi:ubiquinone/menaquinone biosynthesis C-methylase UbiE